MPDRRLHDPAYLRRSQYGSPARLSARISLHDRYSVNPVGWHRWVFDQMDLPADAVVLEVGCGTGALWQRNADRVPAGWRVTLSDFSPGMLAGADRRLREGPWRPAAFLLADVTRLPLGPASVDAVIANHMLYHVDDRERAVAEIARVLRPSGTLFATTNGYRHVEEIVDLARRAGMGGGRVSDAERFGFESGEKLLSGRFRDVEVLVHANALQVPDVEPVVGFLESTADAREVSRVALDYVRDEVARKISAHGFLTVTTEAGMLRARK
ncbi:class I SAM-dependent methyltransferase [Actinoplanes sp. NPDC049596]|uniref:class I SAM-dependent methyltransferase n=1 Tax=unclassified Actinoplanes TaxID=2626549 RepID=UPI003428ABCD